MRIVLFGSGSPMSTLALEALARVLPVAAVVVPAPRGATGLRSGARAFLRWRARRPLVRSAQALGLPVFSCRPGESALATPLMSPRPDLICVASFPYRLSTSLLSLPRLGVLGVHPSLLPRHRGPEPLFWTYLQDDRVAGVSVYYLDAGEDTGDLVSQEEIPLARGRPFADLYLEVARRGAELLVRAIQDIAAGRAARTPQDSAHATREGFPRPTARQVDLSSWSCERTWHVLRALGGHLRLLTDAAGRPIPHGSARSFVVQPPGRSPGTIERRATGWRVFCRDGTVELGHASLRAQFAWAVHDGASLISRKLRI